MLVAVVMVAAAHVSAQGPYTAAQADAGQVEFERKCAGCHEPDARGGRRAPALSGPGFLDKWGDRRVRDLFVRMRDGMPPIGVRPRGDAFTHILAHLLRANGVPPGPAELDPLSYDPLFPEVP